MTNFNDEDFKMQFFEEFKKIDAFYDSFKSEFDTEIMSIVLQHDPHFERTERFEELLSQFSAAALSIAHSVLDKDDTYPDFRKTDDLKSLQAYYERASKTLTSKELSEKLHNATKKLVVKYLPKIVDLSADGFRLMEINLKLFNLEFVEAINHQTR